MTSSLSPERPAGSLAPSEPVWNSRTQWGAIAAGAFAGVLVVFLMGTLGIALGITTGSIAATKIETATTEVAGKAAAAVTIGAAFWLLLTALVTGLVGGWVLNATARRDRPYSTFIFGGITWALGTCILMLIAAPSVGGALSGLGSGAGGAASGIGARSEAPGATAARPEERAPQASQPLSDEQKAAAKDAAEKATAAASGAAWVLLGSQLISIAATMFAAGWNRHTGARVVTEIRPRPLPTP